MRKTKTVSYYKYLVDRLDDSDRELLAQYGADDSIFKELEDYVIANFKRSSSDCLRNSFMRQKKMSRLRGRVKSYFIILTDHIYNHLQRESLKANPVWA